MRHQLLVLLAVINTMNTYLEKMYKVFYLLGPVGCLSDGHVFLCTCLLTENGSLQSPFKIYFAYICALVKVNKCSCIAFVC